MIERVENPGEEYYSPARKFGTLIRKRMEKDPHFYLFSPDETTSNRLDEVFSATERAWGLSREEFDLPESENGRIVEMLSENALFATMVGHIMNGEQAMMTSYEAFFSIILSQIAQQIKFYKQCDEVKWRQKYPAVNLLSTSTCWRQDHNGYTHQSPLVISSLLSIPSRKVNCLFPVDDVSSEECFDFMIKSENVVNFTTFDKNEEPRWIDSYHAKYLFDNGGVSIYQFCSDDNPDMIFTAAGDIATRETILAIRLLKEDMPEMRMRFVGINSLCYRAIGTTEKRLEKGRFTEYFPAGKPIFASFHGYKETLGDILSEYTSRERIKCFGFEEQGSTTTPMMMLVLNHASRYDIAIGVAKKAKRPDLIRKYRGKIEEIRKKAREEGAD